METTAAAPKMAQAIDSLCACPATAGRDYWTRVRRRPATVRGTSARISPAGAPRTRVVLAGSVVAPAGRQKRTLHRGRFGKRDEVRGSGDRDADDRRLSGTAVGEAADAAAGAELTPERAGALREDADAGAVAQRLDRPVEGAAVALAALDRDLAHAVEDRAEALDVPERGLRQRADLTPASSGDADGDRVHVRVVVTGEQHRARARQHLEAFDLHPPPPLRPGRQGAHREAVGAGEGFRLGRDASQPRARRCARPRPLRGSAGAPRGSRGSATPTPRATAARSRGSAPGSPAARTDPRRR